MTITRGEALEMLCKELKIDGKRAQDLIATLPSPYPGDESFPGPIIADLIDRNRPPQPPQTPEEFAALGRSETSSPAALPKNIKQIAIGTGANGCAVVALDDENKLWLWVEGGIMFHELPPVGAPSIVKHEVVMGDDFIDERIGDPTTDKPGTEDAAGGTPASKDPGKKRHK